MSTSRIGIDVTSALTQGGGIGRYTRELVRALSSLQAPFAYTLYSARVPGTLPVEDPLPNDERFTHRASPLPERWMYRLWHRLRIPLPVQLIAGSFDLFHSPDFVLPPVGGRIPTLLTVHDLSFVHFPDVYPQVLVSYLNRVVPQSVARASHIVADSQATSLDLQRLWQVPPEKVTVLYSGVSDKFRPLDDGSIVDSVRERYRLHRRPYILSVGTLQPRKNYQMLIRAFAPLADAFPHDLAIAGGRGWLEEEMMAEADRQGIADRVRFIGFVADEDLPALYNGASLFAFPSLYEGFGLPVLEAMACGAPAIISSSSSLPEVGGEAALQLPPDSVPAWSTALRQVLEEPERAAAMRRAGIEQARRFSWRRAAGELLAVYTTLLDKGATSRHNY